MDRFMLHLKNSGYLPKDAKSLLEKADSLSFDMDVVVRDMRVSDNYLEFDASVSKDRLVDLVTRFETIGKLYDARPIVEEILTKDVAIDKAKQFFNDQRYWECHEVLEGVWKKTFEGEKDLVQGVILVAAALVHYQKYENKICLSILHRSMEKLSNTSGVYHDIDMDTFRKKIQQMIDTEKISTFMI